MKNPVKGKIGSWAISIVESTIFSVFSKIRMNSIAFLEELPDNSSRVLYGICLLLFIVIIAAAGAVILPASLILILVQYASPNVDKILLAGQCFAWLGAFYLIASIVIILMIGKNFRIATAKSTRHLIRKLYNKKSL